MISQDSATTQVQNEAQFNSNQEIVTEELIQKKKEFKGL